MKIYFAGPLFTTAEREFNARIAACLRSVGHEVWLPQEIEQTPPQTGRGIFEKDLAGVDWADLVVACMDGPDPDSGTCWECGRAYGRKSVIAYRTDFRVIDDGFPPFNLMIAESADKVLDCRWKSTDEVALMLTAAIKDIECSR